MAFYTVLKKMNMSYNTKDINVDYFDRVVYQFDKQIKKEYISAGRDRNKCKSYWDKLLFEISTKLEISDWKKIREGDYYLIKDSLKGIDKSKFIYKRIIDYLG